jgi:hypothetical protein
MRSVTELIARFLRSLRMISSRVLVLASFFTGRFARGDDADRFFMADHMYYKEKSFVFGITDGGLAGFGRVTGVHYRDEEVKEHLAGDVKRYAVFLNIGVRFVRFPLERDALQFGRWQLEVG